MIEKLNVKALVKKLNKDLEGEGLIQIGNNIENPFIDRLSTGSIGLDCATMGGIPRGGLTQLIGPESSGKTSMAIKIAVEVQKRFKEDALILYAGIEHPLDIMWAERLGLEINDRVLNISGPSIENILDKVIDIINSNSCQIVIIDSAASFNARAEMEGGFIDQQYAPGAKLMGKFIRKGIYGAALAEDGSLNKTSVIMINQFRDKIGSKFPTKSAPGGWSLKHANLLSIEFSAKQVSEGAGENKVTYGKQIGYVVKKAKAGAHEGRMGSIVLYYEPYGDFKAGEMDIPREYRIIGTKYDVIVRRGPVYDYNGKSWKRSELEEKIKTDEEFRNTLRDSILEASGLIKEENK